MRKENASKKERRTKRGEQMQTRCRQCNLTANQLERPEERQSVQVEKMHVCRLLKSAFYGHEADSPPGPKKKRRSRTEFGFSSTGKSLSRTIPLASPAGNQLPRSSELKLLPEAKFCRRPAARSNSVFVITMITCRRRRRLSR